MWLLDTGAAACTNEEGVRPLPNSSQPPSNRAHLDMVSTGGDVCNGILAFIPAPVLGCVGGCVGGCLGGCDNQRNYRGAFLAGVLCSGIPPEPELRLSVSVAMVLRLAYCIVTAARDTFPRRSTGSHRRRRGVGSKLGLGGMANPRLALGDNSARDS